MASFDFAQDKGALGLNRCRQLTWAFEGIEPKTPVRSLILHTAEIWGKLFERVLHDPISLLFPLTENQPRHQSSIFVILAPGRADAASHF